MPAEAPKEESPPVAPVEAHKWEPLETSRHGACFLVEIFVGKLCPSRAGDFLIPLVDLPPQF